MYFFLFSPLKGSRRSVGGQGYYVQNTSSTKGTCRLTYLTAGDRGRGYTEYDGSEGASCECHSSSSCAQEDQDQFFLLFFFNLKASEGRNGGSL